MALAIYYSHSQFKSLSKPQAFNASFCYYFLLSFAFRYAFLELVPALIYAEREAAISISLDQFFEHSSVYFCVLRIFRFRENQLLLIVLATRYHGIY